LGAKQVTSSTMLLRLSVDVCFLVEVKIAQPMFSRRKILQPYRAKRDIFK
jgi:hypothetical protein